MLLATVAWLSIRLTWHTCSDPSSLRGAVASLRAQLSRVESVLEACSRGDEARRQAAPLPQEVQPGSTPASERPHCGFCGPTSPEYSMNVVRMTLRKRGHLAPAQAHPLSLPSFDADRLAASQPPPTCRAEDQRQLRQFQARLTLSDARDAVSVYGEVVGELHSFVDVGSMQDQLAVWYSGAPSSLLDDAQQKQTDFEHLIIFNLVLAIAARAGTETSYAASTNTMQTVLRCAVDASITSCMPTMKQVTIALLLVCKD